MHRDPLVSIHNPGQMITRGYIDLCTAR